MDSSDENDGGPRFVLNFEEIFQWGIFDTERVLQVFTFLPSEEVAGALLDSINTAYGLTSE